MLCLPRSSQSFLRSWSACVMRIAGETNETAYRCLGAPPIMASVWRLRN